MSSFRLPALPQGALTSQSVYPQRQAHKEAVFDAWARTHLGSLRHRMAGVRGRLTRVVQQAATREAAAQALSQPSLQAQLRKAARQVWGQGLGDTQALAEALALVREAAVRSTGMRPFDTQLLGVACVVTGRLAEMQTGEGKTLTAGLGAALVACAKVPVHVATVNDYLAERDAQDNQALFSYLGLSVGHVITGMSLEQRRAAYACDIAYCTGKELVFDYLKDRVQVGHDTNQVRHRFQALLGDPPKPLLLRGLHFAIVDEADSVFIDEARTPLILSDNAGQPEDPSLFTEALGLAARMQAPDHFRIQPAHRELVLTTLGRQWLTEHTLTLGRDWAVRASREHLVSQALRALHLFHRDQHYIVSDQKVHIVDEHTGRVLPGRIWEGGLHQTIEAKEGCPYSDQSRTVARITYQRFFRRYLRLSGMTGTAQEVRRELWAVYGLETVVVPTHRPSQRRTLPPVALATEAARWARVVQEVRPLLAQGRPVLIGTRTVEASEALSAVLSAHGLPHQLLNARQDADEADMVARAGEPGMLTVATNMAGRGTDIKLPPEVKASGGLHVILTAFHDASRVDRQLFGRAARQGDPGTVQALVCLEDALLAHHAGGLLATVQRMLPAGSEGVLASLSLRLLRWWAQRRAESLHARERQSAMAQDQRMETMLSFSGRH
jgi:preprotein translocase subunit SecA